MPLIFMGLSKQRMIVILRLTGALHAGALLFSEVIPFPAAAQPAAGARPQGGQVVAGQAQISKTDALTRINQSSQRAAIDWRSFDVGSGQQVNFQQPSASAVTLNRVTRPDPSQIAGKITANGQIVLVNQAGVVFTKGSQIEAQSVIVSAAGISNQNFMAGRMVFDQPASPGAQVVNEGRITVKQAGLAALVAPQVKNAGMINAKLGHVILGGAETHTLDLYGDGLLSFDVTGQVKQAPTSKDGKIVTALVINTGTISADGGTVLLTASAVDGIVQNLVTAGGKISASSVGDKTGTIVMGGVGGALTVEGIVAASGRAPGTSGGKIQVASTGDVTLAGGSRVDASGRAGGGTVAIGTTLARATGGPSVTPAVLARSANIENGASVAADATQRGQGGNVTVLSAQNTNHSGAITARGGPSGGDGGFVEVSGHTLGLVGTIDAGARVVDAAPGTLLLDPDDIIIFSSLTPSTPPTAVLVTRGTLDDTLAASAGVIDLQTGNIPPNTVSADEINSVGKNDDVRIAAKNSLTVLRDGVTLRGTETPTIAVVINIPSAITLQAGGIVDVQSGASITARSITLNGGTTGSSFDQTNGGVSMAGALHANNINLSAAGGGITIGSSNPPATSDLPAIGTITAGTLGLVATGSITELKGSTITASGLSATSTGGSVQLNEPNAVGALQAGPVLGGQGLKNVTNGMFSLTNTQSLTIAKEIGGFAGVTLNIAGDLTLGTPQAPGTLVSQGLINLNVTGDVTAPNGRISTAAATLTGTSRSLSLTGLPQLFGTLGRYNAANGIAITSAGNLVLDGAAGNLALDPAIVTSSLHLDAAGTITRTGGALQAGSLSGSAIGLADFGPNAQIGTLGAFSVTGSEFTLNTNGPLIIAGPLSAGFIHIQAPNQVTLAGTIATQGTPVSQQSDQPPSETGSSIVVLPGPFVTGLPNNGGRFLTTANAAITPIGGSPPTLLIRVPALGGEIDFGGLSARQVFLVLDTGVGGGSQGTIDVGGLLVFGGGGNARLFGTVGDVGGLAASAVARIKPQIDLAYTVNGCPIGISCQTPELYPPYVAVDRALAPDHLPPLLLVAIPQLPAPLGWMSSPDIVPPNISSRDY